MVITDSMATTETLGSANTTGNILPLYFMNNVLINSDSVNEYVVCEAVAAVAEKDDITGSQLIGNLWRVYLKTENARARVLQQGINIEHQHIDLQSEQPGSHFRRERNSIKITVKDIPLTYTNDSIKNVLKDHGAKLKSNVINSRIRDIDGNLTNYLNGERIVYADIDHTKINPLPRFLLIGRHIARIHHFCQAPPKHKCTRCNSEDHPRWKCNNDYVCKVCKL